MKSPIERSNGRAEWTPIAGDTYVVTGVTTDGRRFRRQGPWSTIGQINLWRGNRWLLRDGRKYLIQSVTN